MKKLLISGLAFLSLACVVSAQEYTQGDMRVMRPWMLEVPPVSANGAAYLTIRNQSAQDDVLISVESAAAESVEIHEHVHRNGLMKMQKIDALLVKAGSDVPFAPGGYHLMLMGLHQPLKAGERFPVTLHFKAAGDMQVDVEVVQQMPETSIHTSH